MQQNNSPIDKGRVSVVVEKYPSGQVDVSGQPILKNRYATVGRATLWPNKPGTNMPNIEIEIDTMPVGQYGPAKMYIFWDSEQNNQAPQHGAHNQSGMQNHATGQRNTGYNPGRG